MQPRSIDYTQEQRRRAAGRRRNVKQSPFLLRTAGPPHRTAPHRTAATNNYSCECGQCSSPRHQPTLETTNTARRHNSAGAC